MSNNYTRSKKEYKAIVAILREEYGDHMVLPFIRVNQNPKFPYPIISTSLRTDASHLLFQRVPRTKDTTDGVQRALKDAKVAEIADVAKDQNYSAPGAVVTSLEAKDRSWGVEIVPDSPSSNTGHLSINLAEVERRLDTQKTDDSIDESAFMLGYMIDAHHRTEGHYRAGKTALEMNTTIYINLPRTEMARVFALVNEKQEKPSPTHTLAVKQMAGMLKTTEKTAYEIAEEMNSDENSVLFERIKMFDGRLPKGHPASYVNLKPFTDLVKSEVIDTIGSESAAIKRQVLEDYLRAWKAVFPKAWADEKTHVLVKSMGFNIILHLFPRIYDTIRGRINNDSPNQEQFEAVIKLLANSPIDGDADEIPGIQLPLTLDWTSVTFGSMSSGKGIGVLTNLLKRHLSQNIKQLPPAALTP